MRDLWIYWSQATWSLNSASVLKHLAGTVSFTKYTQQNVPWRTNTSKNTREINRLLWNKNIYNSLNSRIRQWSITSATKIWSTASKLICLRPTLIISVHIHISLLSGIFSSAFRLHFARIYYTFLLPQLYPLWFDHPNNVIKIAINNEASHYVIISFFLLLPLTYVQTFPSATLSRRPSILVLP
jgi:hypothetical protein